MPPVYSLFHVELITIKWTQKLILSLVEGEITADVQLLRHAVTTQNI